MTSEKTDVHTTVVHNFFETNIVISESGYVLSTETVLKEARVSECAEQTLLGDVEGTKFTAPADKHGPAISVVLKQQEHISETKFSKFLGEVDLSSIASQIGRKSLKEISDEVRQVVEKSCIEAALSICEGNKASAAKLLGISRPSIYQKIERYSI